MRFNALRLTFADETVERNPFVTQGLAANPQLKGLRSLDIMQRILERAHYFGLRVILCNSRSEAGLGPEHKTGLWYTKQYPASAWQADWVELVRHFRHESAFVGADLFNEPHITGNEFDQKAYFRLGPLWGAYHGQYYFDRDWHYAAQTLGDTLLSINPNLLIVVEGVQLYLDPDRNTLTGGLWGSNLTGVQYDPIALSQPSQLVYSAHEYGPQMFWAQWFNKNTTYQSLAARWDQHWGYLLTAPMSMRAPIFIGEVGTCNNYWACIDSPHPWRQGFWWQSFVRYMTAHPQVGWGYWSLNPDGPFYPGQDNFYSLVTHDWRHTHLFLRLGLAPLLKEGSG
jgi:endoglucanase